MRQQLESFINGIWYPKKIKPWYYYWVLCFLLPFSYLFRLIIPVRKYFLEKKQSSSNNTIPVCVVGNLTVGGTGKTPFVICLANELKLRGYQPAIVSRGYGGTALKNRPILIAAEHQASLVGEEPLLIAEQTGCRVVVCANRPLALKHIERHCPDVDIIISDDGLQHYAMPRAIEIVLMDAQRQWGNGYCLPAGPLREPISRLKTVDYLVVKQPQTPQRNSPEMLSIAAHSMTLHSDCFYQLTEPSNIVPIEKFKSQTVHVITAIANPESLFEYLRHCGIHIIEHSFYDHYFFQPSDFEFLDRYPILVTEKDALKCRNIAMQRADIDLWVIPLVARVPEDFFQQLLSRLVQHG